MADAQGIGGALVEGDLNGNSGLDVTSPTHEERDSFANARDNLKQIIDSKFQTMAQ